MDFSREHFERMDLLGWSREDVERMYLLGWSREDVERLALDLRDLLRSNGIDISKLEFVKPLEKRVICPVCQSVLLRPWKMSCGHHVCNECLGTVFKNNDSATCPVNVDDDCKNIKIDEVSVDDSLYLEVFDLVVKCPLTKHGCSDVTCLYELKYHLYDCLDKKVPCKYNCGVKTERKDILSHYEICPKNTQECEYKFYGCDFEGNPEQMEEHQGNFFKQHLKQVAVYTSKIASDSSAQQQEGILKNGEEKSCLVSELTKEVNNLKLQIKNMDGAAGGTQFDSNNSMADSVSKQLSAHERKLENHDVRIGEMETASYVLTLKKKDDYKRIQDAINEKPGDKVPSWHKDILKRNYKSIIENIRVDDVMDHLFGSEVIDENDMDVIKTKLKSDGNRKALGHLMDILLNSSHTVLTTFINCLHKTRYEYIATRLQEDMDRYGGVGGRR